MGRILQYLFTTRIIKLQVFSGEVHSIFQQTCCVTFPSFLICSAASECSGWPRG